MRLLALVTGVSLLACGETEPRLDPATEARLVDFVAVERQRAWPRPPLVWPGEPGLAVDAYLAAAALADDPDDRLPVELRDETKPVLADPAALDEAPPAIRAYASSANARAVADHVLRGASLTDGWSPMLERYLGEGRLDGSIDHGMKAFAMERATLLVAAHEARAGRPREACQLVLATLWMWQDLQRGGGLVGMMLAVAGVRTTAPMLVELARDPRLSAEDLAEILDSFQRWRMADPGLGAAFAGERLFVAVMALRSSVDPAGYQQTEAMWQGLLGVHGLDDLPAAEQLALVQRAERQNPVYQRPAYEGPGITPMIGRQLHRRALVAAVEVFLAVELHRRVHGHPPATLDELAAGPLARLPLDPTTAEPVAYVRADDGAGSGWIIRTRPIAVPGRSDEASWELRVADATP